MKDELKPCPFCGEDADKTYNSVHGFQVYCSNVECILNELLMVGMDTEEDSFNAWNQRKQNARMGEEVVMDTQYVKCDWCGTIYNKLDFCCPNCQQQDYEELSTYTI